MQITHDSIIGDILDNDRRAAAVFEEFGMRCLGCPASRAETLQEACEIHNVDVNKLINKLDTHFKSN